MPISPPANVLADEAAWCAHDDAVSTVMGVLNGAVARLVELVRQSLDEEWWRASGCRSPEHWVEARCGVSAARARRLERIAQQLHEFPAIAGEARRGLVTEDLLDVVAVHAHPSQDEALAACASQVNVGQLRRVIRSLPVPEEPEVVVVDDDEDDGVAAEPRRQADVLAFGWGDDDRLRGTFDLSAVPGAVLVKALERARDRIFHERTGRDGDDDSDVRSDAVTWADALERLAHAGLARLDPATAAGERPSDRYQVLVHVDLDNLATSRVHLGPLLTKAQRQELTCDADVRAVLREGGRPVGFGRRRRVADPMLRALVEDRDGGCRICGRQGWLHIHHLVHAEDGGPTDEDNLIAACTSCHRAVHAGELRLVGDPTKPDGLLVLDRYGRPLPRPSPTEMRALPDEFEPYPGPDRSGPWRTDPFVVRLDDDDRAVTYF